MKTSKLELLNVPNIVTWLWPSSGRFLIYWMKKPWNVKCLLGFSIGIKELGQCLRKKNCYAIFACNILHLRCISQLFFDFLLSSRLRLIGATTMRYALNMHQRVFRYCANECKMDVNESSASERENMGGRGLICTLTTSCHYKAKLCLAW